MASPQNASLGKYTNDFREGYAESTLGTQGCIHTPQQDDEIHINLGIESTNPEAGW